MLILIALLVLGSVYFLLQALTARQQQVNASMRRARFYGGHGSRDAELGKSVSDRVVGPASEKLAGFALRLTPKGSIEETRRKLRAAGSPNANATRFLAGKALVAGACLFISTVMVIGGGSPQNAFLLALAGGAGAFVFPDYLLSVRARGRRELLVSQMPDVLDLLTVSVEAGLGFDAAVAKVCERMDGPLVEEFRTVMHEMRIGESRARALKNFSDRIDMPDVTTFARSIIQADTLGISLGKILRVQGQDIRHRRQMQAEERAMKAPVKMLFPTAVFIFPAMFVVVLGPAMLSLLKLFS
jgi:tight adherence protein C